MPTHDDLGKIFLNLKRCSSNVNKHLINAVINLLRDRMSVEDIVKRYFNNEPENIQGEIKKFLATLKWLGLQEDTNYPPPNLGSKYPLAIYALLEVGIPLSKIRKVLRYKL